jgi:hypothetical protein
MPSGIAVAASAKLWIVSASSHAAGQDDHNHLQERDERPLQSPETTGRRGDRWVDYAMSVAMPMVVLAVMVTGIVIGVMVVMVSHRSSLVQGTMGLGPVS